MIQISCSSDELNRDVVTAWNMQFRFVTVV